MSFVPALYRISAYTAGDTALANVDRTGCSRDTASIINFADISEIDPVSRTRVREREEKIFLFLASFFRVVLVFEKKETIPVAVENYDDGRKRGKGKRGSLYPSTS